MSMYGCRLEDFGTLTPGDDTPLWQAWLDDVRNNLAPRKLFLDEREHHVDALDGTNITGMEIECMPRTVVRSTNLSAPAPILDLLGSHVIRINGGKWVGVEGCMTPFLICGGDRFILDNVTTDGQFSAGALAVIAASSVEVRGGQFKNYHASAPAVNISNVADWGIDSEFGEIPASPNVGDVDFIATEIHQLGAGLINIYMKNADNIGFFKGLTDVSKTVAGPMKTHFYFEGACKRVTSIAQKFYAELGGHAEWMFFNAAGANKCEHLKVLNAQNDGGCGFTSGNFPWCWSA